MFCVCEREIMDTRVGVSLCGPGAESWTWDETTQWLRRECVGLLASCVWCCNGVLCGGEYCARGEGERDWCAV